MDESTHMQTQKGMHNKAIIMIVAIFVLIVAGMFVFAFLKNTEQAQVVDEDQINNTDTTEDQYRHIARIEGKHYFIDGVHTVVGDIPMPTPCDLLNADAIVAESYPEQITLEFSVINNADTCAQVITPARFKVSTQASEEATFSARLNGRLVELNLVPAGEGETPEEFELFIKG